MCFKTAVHRGQKAVKVFTGLDTMGSQGRGDHTDTHRGAPQRCSVHSASLGQDDLALTHSTGSITGAVHWQPAQGHPAPCWMPEHNEQILPLAGCSLPIPYNLHQGCARSKLEPWEHGLS